MSNRGNPYRKGGRFGSASDYDTQLYEPNKDRQIAMNTSEKIRKSNEETEKSLGSGEYRQDFKIHDYDVVHFHYKDRQEYQIWENGEYLDEAETTTELHDIIKELEIQKKAGK